MPLLQNTKDLVAGWLLVAVHIYLFVGLVAEVRVVSLWCGIGL
jgi:hypothetical protein